MGAKSSDRNFFLNDDLRRCHIALQKKSTRPPVRSNNDKTSVNQGIKSPQVRVIGSEGDQLGIMDTRAAIERAQELGFDLVEVSPNADPPVVKIMDFGKFRYEQDKKKQEAKKKQAVVQLKEIKFRPKTAENDLQTKVGHIRKFIEKKNKVKVTVMFRGREITMSNMGKELLMRVVEETQDVAQVEQEAKFEGRTMNMVLGPR